MMWQQRPQRQLFTYYDNNSNSSLLSDVGSRSLRICTVPELPMRNKSINFGIVLPRQVFEKIDEMRGDVPRSKYIQRLAEKAIHAHEKGEEKENKLQGEKVSSPDHQAVVHTWIGSEASG